MTALRPEQKLSPAKKLTPEVLRNQPFLRKLILSRIKELKAARAAKKASELDFD